LTIVWFDPPMKCYALNCVALKCYALNCVALREYSFSLQCDGQIWL